eukprot:1034370-Prymnesium_polylepis.1
MRYNLIGGLRYALQACLAAALRVTPRRQCNAVRGRPPRLAASLAREMLADVGGGDVFSCVRLLLTELAAALH